MKKSNSICALLLDLSAAIRDNSSTAKAIDFVMIKLDNCNITIPKKILHSGRTNTGSGRTREGLTIKLYK